ncbi:MAG TPA: type IX secretion system membrane protein PorP/SprF [Prolixibacteraceae bacterium]|nr:type IX secretion system membrane protein PorP/SprF [Prolixibacteraceae bacterium]
MKKIITGIILCLIAVSAVDAQQTYQYRYSIFDNYLLNPAYVGTKDYYPILVGRDQRFYGLTASPQTYFLSVNSRVGKGYIFAKDGKINKFFSKFGNLALGFQFTQFVFGPERETNIGMTYGYHLDLAQSQIRRNPRKLILALTPRLQHIWYNQNGLFLVQDENIPYLDNLPEYSTWIFSSDVAALLQTVHCDIGFSALNFFQTKNKLESDNILKQVVVNDTIRYESVSTKDYLYSPKLMINGKVKCIDVYKSDNLDSKFIPSLAIFYAPRRNYTEYNLDLMLDNTFKKPIAGIRKEIVFTGQLGLNINHRREYDPMTLFQPYVAFDFKNYTITYAHSFYIGNDLVRDAASLGGNQISILVKLKRDRVVRDNIKHNRNL